MSEDTKINILAYGLAVLASFYVMLLIEQINMVP
jgi:hypothetical protein